MSEKICIPAINFSFYLFLHDAENKIKGSKYTHQLEITGTFSREEGISGDICGTKEDFYGMFQSMEMTTNDILRTNERIKEILNPRPQPTAEEFLAYLGEPAKLGADRYVKARQKRVERPPLPDGKGYNILGRRRKRNNKR